MVARAALAVLTFSALNLLGGCDTPPNVEVKGVQCVAIGDSEPGFAKLQVDLLLGNPTDEPMQLEVFEYTVQVGETGSNLQWHGSWSALRTLPPRETVPMRIPAVVENPFTEGVENTSWRIFGTISFKAPGRLAQILFDTGFRRPTHDFQGRGPSIEPPAPDAERDEKDDSATS
jgi:hypothetical protein